MAIARGAGTEIIRCASFEEVGVTQRKLIVGVQHHIYTVLTIIIQGRTRSGTEKGYLNLHGYDTIGGDTNVQMPLIITDIAVGETFVWNDKFSFNGYEPVDFTGPMDDATKQDAIADQGGAAQYLNVYISHASTTIDVNVTFIDQNNS